MIEKRKPSVAALLAAFVLLAGSAFAQGPGTITTAAGGGPETLPAIDASLRGNVKVAADSAGNLYVSDGLAHRVYRFDRQSGILQAFAGNGFRGNTGNGGPAQTAQLDNPYALALDQANGRLYIQDNNIIRVVDLATGAISHFAGSGGAGPVSGGMQATQAPIAAIGDIAVDGSGILYVADLGNSRIWAVRNGLVEEVAGNGIARGAADGPGGNPADDYANGVPATQASLGSVTALAAAGGSLYFFEQAPSLALGGARYRRVDLATDILTTHAGNGYVYGSLDGPGGDPQDDVVENAPALQSALAYTTSMVAESNGDLLAAMYTVGLVRRVSSAGTIATFAGGGSSPPSNIPPLGAGLFNITGLSVDGDSSAYIASVSVSSFALQIFVADDLTIQPVVGNGLDGYCGDGGPANAACLREPTAARLDADGNLIIADVGNQRVRAVSPSGIISSLIPALFGNVLDLLPLPQGQLLFSDETRHTVYRSEPPYQSLITFAGTSVATGSIDGPGGDPADDLQDGELAWAASLSAPAGLVQDAHGNTFIADSGNHRVRRVDGVTGVISTVAGTGIPGDNGDGQSATLTDLNFPYGLAFDGNGDLLVSEREGHRVRRIAAGADGLVTGDGDEIVSTVAGTGTAAFLGDGQAASSAALYGPTGLAVDVLGNIYVADTVNRAVRRIDGQSGIIETIAGRGNAGDGIAIDSLLEAPVGLSVAVVNGTSYLYVTDAQQHRVRRIELGPVQGTVNRPPVVDPLSIDGAVLTATSPSGVERIGLYALASDPDGDLLTFTWSGPFGTATGSATEANLPIGIHTITLNVDDGNGHVVSRSATVTVLGENTFSGNGEVLTPPDSRARRLIGETPGRVSVTFLGPVSAPGLTWFRTRTDQVPPPPAGKQPGSAPFYYDIATTAVASGDVKVCLDLTGMSFAAGQVELHRLGSQWNALGASPDPATHEVCTQVPFAQAFGTYANFTTADAATRVTTIAGTGQDADTGDGGPATQASLNIPDGVAFDPARNVLYIGEGSHRVRRVNLTTGVIDTIAGNGTINDPVDGIDARLSAIGSIAGLAIDADGHLFIGDQSHCIVRRVDVNTNAITTVAGRWRGAGLTCGHAGDGGPANDARLGFPYSLTFDSHGNLLFSTRPHLAGNDGGYVRLVSPGADGRITGTDAAETITTIAGTGAQDTFVATGGHPLNAGIFPTRVAVGPGGIVYVGENNGVLALLPGADGIVDGSADESVVRVFGTPLGFNLPFQGDGGLARDAYAPSANGIAVLPSGDLLVSDPIARRIRRISAGADGVVNGGADETIVTIAGFSDTPDPPVFNGDGYALATVFAWPTAMVPGGADSFFVADPVFHRVRRVGLSTGTAPIGADLSVSVAAPANGASVNVGSPLTFDIIVTNAGPASAPAARLRLPLPVNLAFVSASIPGGACDFQAGLASCDVGPLAAGASLHATIVLRPTATGALSGTFDASGPLFDPNQGNNTAAFAITAQVIPVVIDVFENVLVTDLATVTPSAMIGISETIMVSDAAAPAPAVMIVVTEQVTVDDSATVESGPTLTLIPALATAVVGAATTLTAVVNDSTPLDSRVVVSARNSARVQLQVSGPNSPLSVAVIGTEILIGLATNGSNQVTSTAAQLVAAINANPAAAALVTAETWPGSAGGGLVSPGVLTLERVVFSIAGTNSRNESCFTTVPGRCSVSYSSMNAGVDDIGAFLDLVPVDTPNGVVDVGEPVAFGQRTWNPAPNVALFKSIETATGLESSITTSNGAEVTFFLLVVNDGVNNGPTVGPVEIRDNLPPGLTPISATPSPANAVCTIVGQLVSCTRTAPIDRLDSFTVRIVARVGSSVAGSGQTVQLVNTATVTTEADANPGNNSWSASVMVEGAVPPDLTMQKSVLEPSTGVPLASLTTLNGADVTFLLMAQGNSSQPSGPLTGPVIITDTLPAGLTPISATAAPRNAQDPVASCSIAGQLVTCTYNGALSAGAAVGVRIVARVGANLAGIGQTVSLANTAAVTTAGDAVPGNNSSTAHVVVQGPAAPDLNIRKWIEEPSTGLLSSSLTTSNGAQVSFVLIAAADTSQPSGPLAGPVTITDSLPGGLQPISATAAPRNGQDPVASCTVAGQLVTCTYNGPLSATAAIVVRIVAQVGANVAPAGQTVTLTNVGAVQTPSDADPTDNTWAAGVSVVGPLPTCAANVTPNVTVTRGGFAFNPLTQRFSQTVQVRNISGAAIAGPVSLAIDGLSPAVVLSNALGATTCAPAVSPYVVVAPNGLAAGATATTTLQFYNPLKVGIVYGSRVLSGPDPR